MSNILDLALVQPPTHGLAAPERPGVWVILDCGHWYKWSGDRLPTREKDFPCPECEPPIEIVPLPDGAPATGGTR